MFAEMGTTGSVDGSGRLIIKGNFQQKQIENVLRRYIGTISCPVLHRVIPSTDFGLDRFYSRVCHMQDVQVF